MATIEEFLTLDVRVGTVVAAEVLRGAVRPTFTLRVDFGPLGERTAAVEIADMYEAGDLVGLQVAAVVNLPARRVAAVHSEAFVLTAGNGRGDHVLLMPERPVPDGGRVQ